jgi:hypothetical protein
MKTAPPSWLPNSDPEALIKEARRRQRRRRTAVGLTLVVILGGAAGLTFSLTGAGDHSPTGRSAPGQGTPSSGAFAPSGLPAFFADAVTTGQANGSLQLRASATAGW